MSFKLLYAPISARGVDEAGPVSGSNRVNRGGSWNNNPENCRVANRNRNRPDNQWNNNGFRLASTPSPRAKWSHPRRPVPDSPGGIGPHMPTPVRASSLAPALAIARAGAWGAARFSRRVRCLRAPWVCASPAKARGSFARDGDCGAAGAARFSRRLRCLRASRVCASPAKARGSFARGSFARGSFACGFLLASALALLPLSAPAIVVHEDVGLAASAAEAVALMGQPGYEATGWVEIREGASQFRGTGVLVAEDWVLTAAHNWLPDRLTELAFHHGGVRHEAVSGSWIQHPGWLATPTLGLAQGRDLALFQLAAPLPHIAPARLYGGISELGAEVTFLGAGSAGTGATGPGINPEPLLYAGTNVIDRVISLDASLGGGGLLAFDLDDGNAARNALGGTGVFDLNGQLRLEFAGASIQSRASETNLTSLEATSAAGDSGGPIFADFGAGPELVGLFSWGVNPTEPTRLYGSGYGDVAYLTRVSDSREWIVASIPEPAHFGVVFSILALLLPALRRRSFIFSIHRNHRS